MLPVLKSIRRMDPIVFAFHLGSEHVWISHVGEKAYLWFNDLQCYAEQTLELPENAHYRIDVIDTWEMTRTVVNEDVSGNTKIRLPGKEGIAVLAIKE